MISAKRIVKRFAAMDAAKLEALLLKIRKGATSSMTWSQMGEVLQALDPPWKLEKIVGLVKLYGYQGNEEREEHFEDKSREEVDKQRKVLEKDLVSSLPANPKAGKIYVTELSEVQEGKGYTGEPTYKILFRLWMGCEGWRIVTPAGKSIEVLPKKGDLGSLFYGYKTKSRSKIFLFEVIPQLKKETDWLDQINKKLGLEAHVPGAKRTQDGTGSCPVCFQNVKIKDGATVLHGYKRPGDGQAHGQCFGVGYQAFELKVDGTKDFLKTVLDRDLKSTQLVLRVLKKGDLKELPANPYHKSVTPEDPSWDYYLKGEVDRAEKAVEIAKEEVEIFERLVRNWKPRPLPKEGEFHVNWKYKGQRD